MLRDTADHLNAASLARSNVAERHADEDVVFATAATILESLSASPVGWSLQRLFQRRGTVVFTNSRVVVSSSFVSLLTVAWVLVLAYGLYAVVGNPTAINAVVPVVAAAFLFQRRPYFRDIPFQEVQSVNLGCVRGIASNHDVIALILNDRVLHLVPSQIIPDGVREQLLARGPAGRAADASSGTG